MNMSKILFNSLINEGTSKILKLVQKRKSATQFTIKTRSAEMPVILVNMTRQLSVALIPLVTICLFVNKNYLHYFQFSTSYFFLYKVKIDFSKTNKGTPLLQE